MKVIVTGACGFIGSALVKRLADDGHEVVAPVRRINAKPDPRVRYVEGLDLTRPGKWDSAVPCAEAVIHVAARVHRLRDEVENPLTEYRRVNVEGTVALAKRSLVAGVRRFVFLSSIKVNGDYTDVGRRFRADDQPAPNDPYAVSKLEAEEALFRLARERGLEIVVVRPPLIYGPGVKANFETIMRLLARGVPLPLGAVEAKRSMLALDNLVDLLSLCLLHPRAANHVLLASDGEDLRVPEIFRRLGRALDRPARLLPVPPALLEWSARVLGREDLARRLFRSLQIDGGPTRQLLEWAPPVTVDEAFQRTADHFRTNQL